MGTCMSKKKRSSSSSPVSTTKSVSSSTPHLQPQAVTVFQSKVESEREASLKKNKQEDEGRVKKEVFIIKHRKSYSDGGNNDREKFSEHAYSEGVASITMANVAAEAKEVDEILLECGRLSRNSSGKAVSSGERGRRRKHSASKRSRDFDDCENDNTTNAIGSSDLLCEDDDGLAGENRQRYRRRSPVPSSERRRRTPSRERDQQQRSSSRERRVSRSPSKRSLDTTTCNLTNNNINNNAATTRPGKMLSVPPTVSSLAMDKSNHGGGGIIRVSVRRNVGAASPRSQSPARANGNAANGKVTLFSENQQQPSLSRNSSRKAEQSPHRRDPLGEIDVNSLAYSQSANNNSSRFQSKSRRDTEPQANQKTKVDANNIESRTSRMKTKEQQEEEEVKEQSSMTENVNLKTTVIPLSGLDNLKPQALTLTRSRSSRRSRDLDYLLNYETIGIPSQSYTSLLLEDIQNFHQNNNNNITPSIPLPACVAKACSILEAVADLNAITRSNLPANHYAKRVPDSNKEHPFVESEVDVSDDVMEPSLQKYVTTVSRGDSLLGGGVFDMEDQGSSESMRFTVSGQRHVGFSSSSSLKPNSSDSTNFWNSSKRECDSQSIGSGRLGDVKDVHPIPNVVIAAGST